jgi:hypothetical protein
MAPSVAKMTAITFLSICAFSPKNIIPEKATIGVAILSIGYMRANSKF